MAAELSLFGDDPEPGLSGDSPAEPAIADWMVAQIRRALDAREVTTMSERQDLVQSAIGRPVSSLVELTPAEGRQVLESLAAAARTRHSSPQSAWDAREEDTWIDRL